MASLVKEGELVLDVTDEVVAGTLLCRDGAVFNARVRELLGLPELPPAAPDAQEGED
jgi:NAD(P) transhydrogenase subunit alpha